MKEEMNMKKTLAFLLAMVMCLSLLPMGVLADEEAPAAEEVVEEIVEEPAEEPVEEPAEEPVEEPAEEPVEEPAEEPVEEPAEEPVEEPAEEVEEEEAPAEEVEEEEAPAEEASEQMLASLDGMSDEVLGNWVKIGNYWYFRTEYGEYLTDVLITISGKNYYLDSQGRMVTGWHKEPYYWTDSDGNEHLAYDWYYFDGNGVQQFGWTKVGGSWYYLDPDYGYMWWNEWIEAAGGTSWYYLNENGVMVTGWYYNEYDDYWYYFGSDGVQKTGWVKVGSSWYYLEPNADPNSFEFGAMYVDGIYEVDEQYYWFGTYGALKTGWYKDEYTYPDEDGIEHTYCDWYYFTTSGLATGWKKIGGSWYYFDEEGGWMYSGGICEVGGYWDEETDEWVSGTYYCFSDSGALKTGWVKFPWSWTDEETGEVYSGTDWYYFGSDGAAAEGWKKIDGVWYYFDDGWMCTEYWVETADGESWYYLDENGHMVTGWYYNEYDECWYYFFSDGVQAEGQWLKLGGVWYYFTEYWGEMLSGGWYIVDNSGKAYCFNNSGVWTGTRTANGSEIDVRPEIVG